MSTHRKNMDRLLRGLMGLCSGITCLVLLMIIGYILYRGIPSLTWNLLSTEPNNLTGNIGILPNILNTLYIIFVAMIIVLPLGVGAAIYLTEYSTSRKLTNLISFAAEILTGIPSILFGLVGMLIFIQIGGLKQGILDGALTLVLMVLPTIISNTRESLLTVPRSYREGALALGSGTTKGVDADVADAVTDANLDSAVKFVKDFAAKSGAIVAVTGAIDLVSDGTACYVIRNGRPEMGKITGTGCQLSGMMTAFVVANPDNRLEAAAAAVCAMGLAGEIGWSRMQDGDGNSTYRNRIIDAIYNMDGATLDGGAKYELR